jgi:unsaturated rhamnogalacturonyl hydrolase
MNNLDELVVDKLALLTKRLIQLDDTDVHWTADASKSHGFFPRDFGMAHWDWPQGVGLFGLNRLPGNKYDRYIRHWADTEIAKGLPRRNINTTVPMLTLMNYPEFHSLAKSWVLDIEQHFPRTDEDGLEHFTTGNTKETIVRNPEQLWADTVFMCVLFLTKMAQQLDRRDLGDEATYQVLLHIKYLLDPQTSLFSHGWDFKQRHNFGNIFWCRGNSWMAYGLPLYLESNQSALSSADRRYLANVISNQMEQLFSLQDTAGLWHTVLDDSSSYIETSGSAGIIAGVFLALRLGILPSDFAPLAQKSLVALLSEVTDQGVLDNVSAGTPLSANKTDYKQIRRLPMAYGQALAICACAEYMEYRNVLEAQL